MQVCKKLMDKQKYDEVKQLTETALRHRTYGEVP